MCVIAYTRVIACTSGSDNMRPSAHARELMTRLDGCGADESDDNGDDVDC